MDIDSLFVAGDVRRCHALRALTESTVASHSWGVTALVVALFPDDVSVNLLKAALFHDIGEHVTGDIPTTMKWRLPPTANDAIDRLEREARVAIIGADPMIHLSYRDKLILKLCDMVEFGKFVEKEIKMGNSELIKVQKRVEAVVRRRWRDIEDYAELCAKQED